MSDNKKRPEEEDDEDDEEIGDEELDEELNLPDVLRGISNEEKRSLLDFKNTHNERDWEEEILRRSDLLARKVDMERLKRMAGTTTSTTKKKSGRKGRSQEEEEEEEEETAPKRKVTTKAKTAATKGKGGRGKMTVDSEDDDDDDDEEEEEEEEEGEEAEDEEEVEEEEEDDGAMDDFEDDDDEDEDALFDSEEEEEFNKLPVGSSGGAKVLGSKRKSKSDNQEPAKKSTRSSSRRRGSSAAEEEEEEEEEDSEEELYGRRRGRAGGEQEEDGYGGNLGSIKNRAGRGASAAGGKKKKTKKHKKYGDESGSSSGEDSDEEDDDEEALRLRRKREKDRRALLEDKSGPGNLESYLRVQLRRYQIVALIKEPFVKQALVGQYVRFTVGEIAQQAVCRMCEILAVELDARPYRMAESGQMCTTRLTLAMAGSVKKSVRICLVSNSRITQDEFDFYRAKLRELRGKPAKVDGEEGEEEEDSEPDEEDDDEDYFDPKTVTRSRARRRLLTKQQIEAQRMTLKSYLMGEHVYTDKEVKEMVSKSAGLDKSKTTEFTTAMESLQKKLAAARDSTDYEALEVIQKTIDTLQQRYDEQKEIFDRTAKKQMMVNRKMKLSNIERDMAAGKRLRQEQLAAEARGVKSNAQADPFTRRECRPKILWNTGTTLDSLAATGAGSADSAAGAGADAGEATEGDIGDAAGVAGSGSGSVEPSTASLLSTQQQPQNQQQQQQQHTQQRGWREVEHLTLEQIRRRVKQRLGGVDPLAEAARSQRERYLARVCSQLPALGSEERQQLRQRLGAKSLEEAVQEIAMAQEEEEEEEEQGGGVGGSSRAMEI